MQISQRGFLRGADTSVSGDRQGRVHDCEPGTGEAACTENEFVERPTLHRIVSSIDSATSRLSSSLMHTRCLNNLCNPAFLAPLQDLAFDVRPVARLYAKPVPHLTRVPPHRLPRRPSPLQIPTMLLHGSISIRGLHPRVRDPCKLNVRRDLFELHPI